MIDSHKNNDIVLIYVFAMKLILDVKSRPKLLIITRAVNKQGIGQVISLLCNERPSRVSSIDMIGGK